jgi:xylulokinase
MQADIFNVPVKVTRSQEQAGLGAAITAGVGAGLFSDLAEASASAVHFDDEIVYPDEQDHDAYQEYYACYKKAYAVNRDLLRELHEVRLRQIP